MGPRSLSVAAIAVAFAAGVAAAPRSAHAEALLVTGAGATFPYPLYAKWFSEYNNLRPEYRFNYQPIGSGGGIKQIIARTVDFAATDSPMTDDELRRAPQPLLHLPLVAGAVAVVYHRVPDGLRLDADTLAAIFLGTITRWDDPRLVALNPGLPLPPEPIVVVHRSDGSGTTRVFSDYLSKVSPAWQRTVGSGKSIRWPVGVGMKGNEGVTSAVQSIPYSIGYVELAYARQSRLAVATLRNRAGTFVRPMLEAVAQAATAVELPADLRVSLTDAAAPGAYPLAAFTYLLVEREQRSAEVGEALVSFVWWALHDGQKLAAPLDYVPLPPPVVARVEALVRSITVGGRAVLAVGGR
jgi:phosphate transport system substrate-binding protein